MSDNTVTARRATVDDLPLLRRLWQTANMRPDPLERHLTEFQLVFSMTGELVGAVALQVQDKHGRIHSEAFFHPENEDDFRPLLWERIKGVARNHGLVRLWTLEQAPFYHQQGFRDADPEVRKRFPSVFGDRQANWMTLQLRDEIVLSLDKEFEVFRQSQEESTARLMAQAKTMKTVAVVVAIVLFLVVAVALAYLIRSNMRNPRATGGNRGEATGSAITLAATVRPPP